MKKHITFSTDLHHHHHQSKLKNQTTFKMPSKCGLLGVATIFVIVSITLYFAFAFPYSLFHLKQTETTEIKSVIIIGRNGETSPKLESYFIGESPPNELTNLIGYDQLSNIGKERMFLLGKFLKLRYYHLLLNGNPRKLKVRSSNTDKCLESAEALLAGLNPPKDNWLWSTTTGDLNQWQPKAIQTTEQEFDDLLAEDRDESSLATEAPIANCYAIEEEELKWKNSTKYQQLLNEFRHDLQLLRSNTGLEFEDDLEIVSQIDDSLKTRKAYKLDNVPSWYTTTFANRLAHITDVATENRFSNANMQRLYVGRLLHEIAETVNSQIKLHQQELLEQQQHENNSNGEIYNNDKLIQPTNEYNTNSNNNNNNNINNKDFIEDPDLLVYGDLNLKLNNNNNNKEDLKNNKVPVVEKTTSSLQRKTKQNEPNMFIYMTNKNKLSALMNSLQVFSSQPTFGSLLLIEVHYDPINNIHFLRLYSVSSTNPNVLPEPVRLNPIACVDSAECEPQQFEQNIRHLMLDKNLWKEICINREAPPATMPPKLPLLPIINDNIDQPEIINFRTTTTTTNLQPSATTSISVTSTTTTTTTELPEIFSEPQQATTTSASNNNNIMDQQLDQNLIVGPTNISPSGDEPLPSPQTTTPASEAKMNEPTFPSTNFDISSLATISSDGQASSTTSKPETILTSEESTLTTITPASRAEQQQQSQVEASDEKKSKQEEYLEADVNIESLNQAPGDYLFETNKIDS